MPKQMPLVVEGIVNEALGNGIFKVTLDAGQEVVAHLAGKMRMNNIIIIIGDRVSVELSPYDLTKGRISRRLKQNN
jgi:translation initiation factor IF-1